MGHILPDQGDLSLPTSSRIAHMAQEVGDSTRSALDYVLDGHQAYRSIEKSILKATETEDNDQLAILYEEFESIGGYSAKHQAAELLNGLGFSNEETSNPVNAFSGGWRIRLNLAQALMMPSDIMLLDEPTNHLDMVSKDKLKQAINEYTGTVIVVSHDRDF